MVEPVHEMSRELVNVLERAADTGAPLTGEQMREELGVGHDDLRAMLDQLREQGIAEEVAPGEWARAETPAPTVEMVDSADGRVTVTVPREPVDEGGPIGEGTLWASADPDVRLTRAIAERLSDEALGQLVKAGLEDSSGDGPFLLEITP